MSSNTRLNGSAYIRNCEQVLENSEWFKKTKAFVQSVITEIANLDSFEKIARSLARDTNSGRLIMIYLYAEELKKILPDRTKDIDLILVECLQEGFVDMIRQ
jgi:hypothetical protein